MADTIRVPSVLAVLASLTLLLHRKKEGKTARLLLACCFALRGRVAAGA